MYFILKSLNHLSFLFNLNLHVMILICIPAVCSTGSVIRLKYGINLHMEFSTNA